MSALARPSREVLTVAGCAWDDIRSLAGRFGLTVCAVADGETIPGSYWGEPEAGVIRTSVYLRGDTPLHSCLHELCHVVCMPPARRDGLVRDAGGDDAEECAVCYLQVLLADELPGVGRARLTRDMDAWGYSFRLGSAAAWFERDAADARAWLERHGLVDGTGRPRFRLRDA